MVLARAPEAKTTPDLSEQGATSAIGVTSPSLLLLGTMVMLPSRRPSGSISAAISSDVTM